MHTYRTAWLYFENMAITLGFLTKIEGKPAFQNPNGNVLALTKITGTRMYVNILGKDIIKVI